jgi:hypothetical protein
MDRPGWSGIKLIRCSLDALVLAAAACALRRLRLIKAFA